jgi:predicted small integral membrane protein
MGAAHSGGHERSPAPAGPGPYRSSNNTSGALTTMFDWMAWTLPVAVFFCSIVVMLIGMTVWELKSPTTSRRGWLPMETTRGDRLFIGLLSAAYVNLAFVAVSEKMVTWFTLENEPSIWISFVVSMGVLALVMRKG